MKRSLALAFLVLAVHGPLRAQQPAPAEQQQIQALVAEVRAQQTTLAENQAKIDAKLATIAEAVRIARIYASRSGH
jgi:hypothetical protein